MTDSTSIRTDELHLQNLSAAGAISADGVHGETLKKMDGFDADPVELQVCGSNLGQISDELHTELRTLQRHMDDLLTSRWQGAAATGFAKGWQLWLHGAKDVLDALAVMGRLLGETGRDYQDADASSTDMVRASGVRL